MPSPRALYAAGLGLAGAAVGVGVGFALRRWERRTGLYALPPMPPQPFEDLMGRE